MEEQDLQKRADCVHFMASPLPTCDKQDCRLNPKVCWFWLAGDCRKPICALRHPPLVGYEAEASDSAPSTISANKSNIPCYFYLNGMCNKGDSCSFLHDIDGSASTGKCSNTASACTETLPSENKASVINETVSASTVAHHNPSEVASKTANDTRIERTQDLDYQVQPQKNASPHVSEYPDEEADRCRSSSLLPPAEGSIHSKSPEFTDQSSEEGADDLILRDE